MLRMVYEDYDYQYKDVLSKSHMTTQECQRTITLLATEVYKAVNGRTSSYILELPEVKQKPYNLRDPSRTIIPKSNSTTYGLKSRRHEGNTIWNRLLVNIKTLHSLAIFKREISKWQPRY